MKKNGGMTYIELIVVLGIFASMLSIAMYNHNKFQDKVSIKNLANEVALRIVEAQRSAMAGKASTAPFSSKPSYGVHFNLQTDNKSFIYFADFNASGSYSDPTFCNTVTGECLAKITLNRANTISNIAYYYSAGGPTTLNNLTVTFTRPASDAAISSSTPPSSTVLYAQITVASVSGTTARIKIYPSGRIQIN
ncbi:MAG: type II secretion system protein [Patescibacteria group bacterium]